MAVIFCPECGRKDVVEDLCSHNSTPMIHCRCGDVQLPGYPAEWGEGLSPDGIAKLFGETRFSIESLKNSYRFQLIGEGIIERNYGDVKIYSLEGDILDLNDSAIQEIHMYNPIYVSTFQAGRRLANVLRSRDDVIPMGNNLHIVSLNGERSGLNTYENLGIHPRAVCLTNEQEAIDRLRSVFGSIAQNMENCVIITFNVPNFSRYSTVLARALSSDCKRKKITIVAISKEGVEI